jgi:hypothetical protein
LSIFLFNAYETLYANIIIASFTPKKPHLSRDQRRDIQILKLTGMSQKQIVAHFLFILNVIITIRQVSYACFIEYVTFQKRSGHFSFFFPERVVQFIEFVIFSRLARQMIYLQLSVYFNWNVGEYAIWGAFRRAGFYRYVAHFKSVFSVKNIRDRLAWAYEHRHWTFEQ